MKYSQAKITKVKKLLAKGVARTEVADRTGMGLASVNYYAAKTGRKKVNNHVKNLTPSMRKTLNKEFSQLLRRL